MYRRITRDQLEDSLLTCDTEKVLIICGAAYTVRLASPNEVETIRKGFVVVEDER